MRARGGVMGFNIFLVDDLIAGARTGLCPHGCFTQKKIVLTVSSLLRNSHRAAFQAGQDRRRHLPPCLGGPQALGVVSVR